jgi:hypothetical protein
VSLAVAGAGVIDASSHRCFGLPGVAHYLLAGIASAPLGNSRQGERPERGLAVDPWTASQNEPAARIHERRSPTQIGRARERNFSGARFFERALTKAGESPCVGSRSWEKHGTADTQPATPIG